MKEKRCTQCKTLKDLEDFPKNKQRPDGHDSWCRPCKNKKMKAWREKNPEKSKKSQKIWRLNNPGRERREQLRTKYGMGLEDYEKLLMAQNNVCAICKLRTIGDNAKGHLCVDHIEGTLEVRGLLCSRCNTAIGLFEHDAQRLLSAVKYLSKPPAFVGKKASRAWNER